MSKNGVDPVAEAILSLVATTRLTLVTAFLTLSSEPTIVQTLPYRYTYTVPLSKYSELSVAVYLVDAK